MEKRNFSPTNNIIKKHYGIAEELLEFDCENLSGLELLQIKKMRKELYL